ncbi:hypothetical protein EDB80DRAFT_869397 [Ilyonectria destructans]|nr:hypothetical protein EDB80DRAFT_869397 [Ilyonectria destructans]
MYKNAETHKNEGKRHLDKEADTPLFGGTVENCKFDGEGYRYELNFGAHVRGKFKPDFTYGFMIASMDNVFNVKQANRWLNVEGESDQAFFQPFTFASFNNTDASAASPSAPYFDGKLSIRMKSGFGDFNVSFLPNPEDKLGTRNVERDDNRVSVDNHNFGLKVSLGLFSDLRLFEVDTVDVDVDGLQHFMEWTFFPSPCLAPATCPNTTVKTLGMQVYKWMTTLDTYGGMTAEQQLLATEERWIPGIVFKYLNDPTPLWVRVGKFEAFYATQGSGVAIPSLPEEWKEFMEIALTSMVHLTKAAFELQTVIALGGLFNLVPSMALHGVY